jgi:predicted small secreted protein
MISSGTLVDQSALSQSRREPILVIYERPASRAMQSCTKASTRERELLQIRVVSSAGFDPWFLEVAIRQGKRHGLASLLRVVLMVTGAGSMLSACNTAAGKGQDVPTVGNAVTSGATQRRRATGLP